MATAPAALSAATIAGDAAAASLPATIVYVTVSGDAAADMPQAPPPPPNPPPPSPTPRRPQRSPETVVIANLAFAVSPPLHPQCSSYYRRTAAHNATPRLVEPPHSPTMQLLVSGEGKPDRVPSLFARRRFLAGAEALDSQPSTLGSRCTWRKALKTVWPSEKSSHQTAWILTDSSGGLLQAVPWQQALQSCDTRTAALAPR